MRALVVLVAALGCKSSPPAATAAEARQLAEQLVAAFNACDRAALDKLVDIRALAGDELQTIAADAWRTAGPCTDGAPFRFTLLGGENPARPIIRWVRASGPLDVTAKVGYLELIAGGAPARIVDLATPLHHGTLAGNLASVRGEPRGDWPGRAQDATYFLFMGFARPSSVLLLDLTRPGTPANDRELGWAIEHGMGSADATGVAGAVAKVEIRTGRDPYLSAATAVAQRAQPREMLLTAGGLTHEFPAEMEGWLVQLFAEVATGELGNARTTLAKLVAAGYDKDDLMTNPRLAPLGR